MQEQRGRVALGCGLNVAILVAGAALGAALTLGLLGIGWDVLFGRAFNPGGAPVVQIGPTVTPAPAAMAGAAPGRRFVPREPIALDSDTSTPDLLVISRNYDRETSTITYLSPDNGAARWESPPLSDGSEYAWSVAYGDEHVAVAMETRLLGLSRATGEQVWEAPLTDSVFTGCKDCVRVFDDTVVVLSEDGQLQSFAVNTGAPRWSVRLREATRQIVEAGGLVGVPDKRADGEYGAELRRFAPADGAEAPPITLECQGAGATYASQASTYDYIGHDPQGRLLLWLIDSDPTCLLSLDVATGAVAGRTFLEAFGGDLAPERMLWAGDTLYLSDQRQIIAVGAQEARSVTQAEDYNLAPLAAGDGVLMVLAERTRGSSRLELWALDAASGERRWERILAAGDRFLGGTDTGSFVAAVVGDALALVETHEEPEELRYELIGLRDGVSRARAILGVQEPSDYIRGAIWGREQLILAADELYTIDLKTGQVTGQWP